MFVFKQGWGRDPTPCVPAVSSKPSLLELGLFFINPHFSIVEPEKKPHFIRTGIFSHKNFLVLPNKQFSIVILIFLTSSKYENGLTQHAEPQFFSILIFSLHHEHLPCILSAIQRDWLNSAGIRVNQGVNYKFPPVGQVTEVLPYSCRTRGVPPPLVSLQSMDWTKQSGVSKECFIVGFYTYNSFHAHSS